MPLLNDIVIIFGLSCAVLFLCHRLKVPAIVGFLATGTLAGPKGLGLISNAHEVELLAEVGVILLLFTIGMEFSFQHLARLKRPALLGGSIQVCLTIAAALGIGLTWDLTLGEAVFLGFLLALSSTAIVLSLLQQRGEVESPHGRAILGVLIFQDIAIVPMMLSLPLLAGSGDQDGTMLILTTAGKAVGVLLLVFLAVRKIVPHVLHHVARTKSSELFLLTIVLICLAITWLTNVAGLSLALGAFLAGLVISESEYSHQALGNILPFRDVFTSFFFVSIGMLLDTGFVVTHALTVVGLAAGVFGLKTILATVAVLVLGYPIRTALLSGLALCQVGEFSFILAKAGTAEGLFSGDSYQYFLAASVLTMAATPFILMLAPRLAGLAAGLPLPARLLNGVADSKSAELQAEKLENHLIIVGYGVSGRMLSTISKAADIPYLIFDMNPDTVRREGEKGEPILFGEAVSETNLARANIKKARAAVIAISDPVAVRRIIAALRRASPAIHIIVRTRFYEEVDELAELGADEVIAEEFESSVDLFVRVLTEYVVPREEIEQFVAEMRADGYRMFRSPSSEFATVCNLSPIFMDMEMKPFKVEDDSQAAGKTLAELRLGRDYEVTALVLKRGRETIYTPSGEERLHVGETLIVVGLPDKIAGARGLFMKKRDGKELNP
jgi:monovalent cation:H+ antiporter-2, CPA2 family